MAGKRAAGSAVSPSGDARSAKRQRTQNGDSDVESPEQTTQKGLAFLQSLKQSNDKTGRSIVKEFLTLPSQKEVPQYYVEIKLPVALDTIERRLNNREYANISELEGDVKRMVANAKHFNDKRSALYEDAERIRKTTSNWMTRHNPAYRDPSYVAQPTPIPDNQGATRAGSQSANLNGMATPTPAAKAAPSLKLTLTNKAKNSTSAPVPAEPSASAMEALDKETSSSDFRGLSFSQAQDKIMSDMLRYTDGDGGLEVFTPFATLPSRQLKDYYEVIKKPTSLKSVQKLANGVHGRNAPTGISDFKSWDAFEEEVSYIWRNARAYNEDGTPIFDLANEFEEVFKARLAEAKAVVSEPQAPTLKLKMSAPANPIKIKLNTGASRKSPSAEASRATPEQRATPALDHKDASITNGAVRPPSSDSATRPGGELSRTSSGAPTASANPANTAAAIASSSAPQTAATNNANGDSHGIAVSMLPPASTTTRPPSGSPHPHTAAPAPTNQPPPQSTAPPIVSPRNGFERYRKPGKGPAEALMPKLTLQTHPHLALPHPVRINVPAHPRLTAQSATITLPATHHTLQIVPQLPIALTGKPYRVFVNVNGRPALRMGTETDRTRPVYEGRLERGGVNRIEVEVLAAKDGGGGGGAAGEKEKEKEGVEWEKSTVFVHLPKV